MKVLLINGSPRANGCTFTALTEIANELKVNGVDSEIFHVLGSTVGAGIEIKEQDVVKELATRLEEFDGIIVGSPVYYASPTGSIISFMDRLWNVGSKMLFGKPAACIASCRRGGATATLDVLQKYFAFNEMPIVTANYWNMVHGNTPEEVVQDIEGMQNMRILAKNMAWMIKCLDIAKQNGITKPVQEERIKFNYVR